MNVYERKGIEENQEEEVKKNKQKNKKRRVANMM